MSIKPLFGDNPFSEDERLKIQKLLEDKLGKEQISFKTSADGRNVAYLDVCKAVELANDVFGFDGWSSSVTHLSQDYFEEDINNQRVRVGVSAIVRVTLRDGTYHEDVGYGTADGQKTKAQAMELAKKAAISDGLKRALRLFGNLLGNSIYDKENIKRVGDTRNSSLVYRDMASALPSFPPPSSSSFSSPHSFPTQSAPPPSSSSSSSSPFPHPSSFPTQSFSAPPTPTFNNNNNNSSNSNSFTNAPPKFSPPPPVVQPQSTPPQSFLKQEMNPQGFQQSFKPQQPSKPNPPIYPNPHAMVYK